MFMAAGSRRRAAVSWTHIARPATQSYRVTPKAQSAIPACTAHYGSSMNVKSKGPENLTLHSAFHSLAYRYSIFMGFGADFDQYRYSTRSPPRMPRAIFSFPAATLNLAFRHGAILARPGPNAGRIRSGGQPGVGLTYNKAGFGVNARHPDHPLLYAWTPYESFAAGYTIGGTNSFGNNYKDGSVQGITTTSLTNLSSGLKLSAEWIGVLNSKLEVKIDYSFNQSDFYFSDQGGPDNMSGTAMRTLREFDPDNTEFADGAVAFRPTTRS